MAEQPKPQGAEQEQESSPDIYLTISPPDTQFDLARELQRHADGARDVEWQNFVNQSLGKAEAGGQAMGGKDKISSPQESTSEQVRDKASITQGPVREGLDKVLRTLTGVGLDDVEKSVREGTLPQQVSLKLMDPVGNTAETLVHDEAIRSGLDESTATGVSSAAGLLFGMLGGGGKKKGMEKVGEMAVGPTMKMARGAANINTARIKATEDVKQTITHLNELMAAPGGKLAAAREPVTHGQTIAAGQARGMTIEEALALNDNDLLLESARATQQALRDLHNRVATVIDGLRAATMKGDQVAADNLARVWPIAGEIGAKDELIGKGGGRILEARKIPSQAERAAFTVEDFAKVQEKMTVEGVDGFTIARYLTQIQGTNKRASFLTQVWNGYKATNDAFHWLYLQFLLSGPQTHAANIVGTGAIQLTHYPERYVAEWINRALFRNPDGVQRGEALAAALASGRAATDGLIWMGRAIKTGEQALGGVGRIDARFDLSSAALGLDPNTAIGKIADVAGRMTPTRLMMTEDAFFKGFAYRTELGALALREAMKQERDPNAIARLTKHLELNPSDEMKRLATEAALLRTLNNELGPVGRAAMNLRSTFPVLGWVIAPFLQTPGNSYKWFYQRAPILSVTSLQNWKDVFGATSTPATRDMAMSRMLIGNAVGLAVGYQVLNGRITGGLPVGSNKNMKRDAKMEGLEPYTIQVGDERYGYKRTDPVGQYIGAIATAIEIKTQLAQDDPQDMEWEDFAIAAALTGSRVALDTPWLMGISNVMTAIAHPDVDGKKMAQGFAKSLIPRISGTITRMNYPELRELDSIVDAMKAEVPWMVTGVAPYLHPILGEPIERPPGWGVDGVSPIFVATRRNDPVLLQIIEHKMDFPEPPKHVYGTEENDWSLDPARGAQGYRYTPGEYFTLKYLATKEIRDGQGRTMHDAMVDMINSTTYQNSKGGPDGVKEKRLKLIYHAFYDRAFAQMLKESPELKEKLKQLRLEQHQRENLPESHPMSLPSRVPPGLPASLGR